MRLKVVYGVNGGFMWLYVAEIGPMWLTVVLCG